MARSIAAAALMAAIEITGAPLAAQRIVLLGAGSAGCGIGSLLLRAMRENGLNEREAQQRFFAVDRDGLLIEGMDVQPAQCAFVQPRAAVADWKLRHRDRIELLDVVRNVRPTALIAVSGQPGAITEPAVRAMAAAVERPIILPLSNPTSRAEATPEDLMRWSDGRAIIGTGSPFPPVKWKGKLHAIDQTNNSYIFPGLGLGVLAVNAQRITEAMFMAAAKALAALSPARRDPAGSLLPPVSELRAVAFAVATAVARQAQKDRVASGPDEGALGDAIRAQIWEPVYRPYRRPKG